MKINYIDLSTQDGPVSIYIGGQCNHAEAYIFEQSKNYTENLVVCPRCDESWVEENELMDYREWEHE